MRGYKKVSMSICHGRLARWRKWRACDVEEAKERFDNDLWRRWSNGRVGEWAPFRHFNYVAAHSPTFPSLHLRHSSFSNPSVTLPTSQLILQPFRCFTYVTAHSTTLVSFLLRHRLFTYVIWRAAHAWQIKLIKLLTNCLSIIYLFNYLFNEGYV